MKLQALAAACAAVAALSAAGSALAEQPITAKLQQPVAAKTKIIAGGAVFVCEADSCYAGATTSRTLATASCKDLAKSVGAITAFGDGRKSLDDARLAQCNAVASSATEVAKR